MLKPFILTLSTLILLVVTGCATSISPERPIDPYQLASYAASKQQVFTPTDALDDLQERVSNEFKIPKGLRPRVHFWFNIYTKYGSNDHVIHHLRYPWIVFKVVNTDSIYNSKAHRWTKYHRARRLVQREKKTIRRALSRLSRRKSYRNLKGLERTLYNKLKWVRGRRSRVFKFASGNIRSQLGQKDFYTKGLGASRDYFNYMEDEFQSYGLPKELTRLPFVESSFNIHAQSSVGASGIWQIMPRTGASYATVNKYIDERNSPYKATTIAARLLRSYYKSFKSWPLAVTAYNNGIAGLKRTMRSARSRDLHTIIKRSYKGSFKFASSNFYSSFLAALYAYSYRQEIFNVNPNRDQHIIPIEVIALDRRYRPKTLLRLTGATKDDFLKYNLDLKNAFKKNRLLPRGYKLILPNHMASRLRPHLAKSNSRKKRKQG